MSTSRTEFSSQTQQQPATEQQQQSSSQFTSLSRKQQQQQQQNPQQQLKWRKGINSNSPSPSLLFISSPQSVDNINDIATTSSTDFATTISNNNAASFNTENNKTQLLFSASNINSSHHANNNTPTVADLKHQTEPQQLLHDNVFDIRSVYVSADEAIRSSMSPAAATATGSDSATTRLQVFPSPETIRTNPHNSDSSSMAPHSTRAEAPCYCYSCSHKNSTTEIKPRYSLSSFSQPAVVSVRQQLSTSDTNSSQFKSDCSSNSSHTQVSPNHNHHNLKSSSMLHHASTQPPFTTDNACGGSPLSNSNYCRRDSNFGTTPSAGHVSQPMSQNRMSQPVSQNRHRHSLSLDISNANYNFNDDSDGHASDGHVSVGTSSNQSPSSHVISGNIRCVVTPRFRSDASSQISRRSQKAFSFGDNIQLEQQTDKGRKRMRSDKDESQLGHRESNLGHHDDLQSSTSADSYVESPMTESVTDVSMNENITTTDEPEDMGTSSRTINSSRTIDNNNGNNNHQSDYNNSNHRDPRLCSTLCQCPCRSCATCPLRSMPQTTKARKDNTRRQQQANNCNNNNTWDPHNHDGQVRNSVDDDEDDDEVDPTSQGWWSRLKRGIVKLGMLEVKDDPIRYKYDVRVIPEDPLPNQKQRLLEITELPFLILWGYFTYWAVIVVMTTASSPATVWLSAAVASVLVGIGLNANAYKSVTVPRRRGAVRHHRHARALLELRKYGESFDAVEMKIDWGIVVRFFLIPFGVSSLSGLTNSNRDEFLLVFPRDPFYLMIAILCPAVVVTCLAILRLGLLWKLKVRWSLQGIFLNGALVD